MFKVSSFYLRFFGLGKSQLSRILGSILSSKVVYFIKIEQYELILEVCCPEAEINEAKLQIMSHLSSYLVGTNQSASIEKAVGQKLIRRKLSITSAESLTAGMFQSTLGNVPGISAVFPGGFVTYSNHAKHQLLEIPSIVIDNYGVVSKPVAKWMARQSRRIMGTDLSVSFTGAAGPASLEGQPAGTVWIGIATKNHPTRAYLYHLASLYKELSSFRSSDQLKQDARNGIRLLSVKIGFKLINDVLNRK